MVPAMGLKRHVLLSIVIAGEVNLSTAANGSSPPHSTPSHLSLAGSNKSVCLGTLTRARLERQSACDTSIVATSVGLSTSPGFTVATGIARRKIIRHRISHDLATGLQGPLRDIHSASSLDLLNRIPERGRRNFRNRERAYRGENVGLQALQYVVGVPRMTVCHPAAVPLPTPQSQMSVRPPFARPRDRFRRSKVSGLPDVERALLRDPRQGRFQVPESFAYR